MSRRPKPWTVLVWIAGDNNLDAFGLEDIGEMKEVGSDEHRDVVVQFDRAGTTGTRRYHLHRDTSLEDDLVDDLGETNTGDPAVATDFFAWGIETFPSDRVLGVLWNHGGGIDEKDIYNRGRGRTIPRRVAAGPMRRALFDTTVAAALRHRGIAYDDAARDFLDNRELTKVLADVHQRTGRTIDVLGFDACLMSMIEVGYELRAHAGLVVGSEQTEPGEGWPYERVLGVLRDDPAATPESLATGVVDAYLASYAGSAEAVTQSALDLSRIEASAQAVEQLAAALVVALPDDPLGIMKAVKNVQRFEHKDFADLGDFCRLLGEHATSHAVVAAANGVRDALGTLVRRSIHQGPGVDHATGVAIYLPLVGDVTVAYDELAFATDARWQQFLLAYKDL